VASEAALISRIRLELGDGPMPFRGQFRGTGMQETFDLPANNVSSNDLRTFIVEPTTLAITDLVPADYTIDLANGLITLNTMLTRDHLLVVEGYNYSLFSDAEISQFLREALLQHTSNGSSGDSGTATDTVRYRDENGFIKYSHNKITLDSLPEVEEVVVALLAATEALWALSTDASTDIDVHTSEGTFVPRSQRYGQIVSQINLLTEKYKTLCAQLNVGLYRIEMSTLRRISKTTGRLVPVYVPREYDDSSMPVRVLPEIDNRDADPDGPPSAANQGLF
jgi:hypothetical protein